MCAKIFTPASNLKKMVVRGGPKLRRCRSDPLSLSTTRNQALVAENGVMKKEISYLKGLMIQTNKRQDKRHWEQEGRQAQQEIKAFEQEVRELQQDDREAHQDQREAQQDSREKKQNKSRKKIERYIT